MDSNDNQKIGDGRENTPDQELQVARLFSSYILSTTPSETGSIDQLVPDSHRVNSTSFQNATTIKDVMPSNAIFSFCKDVLRQNFNHNKIFNRGLFFK